MLSKLGDSELSLDLLRSFTTNLGLGTSLLLSEITREITGLVKIRFCVCNFDLFTMLIFAEPFLLYYQNILLYYPYLSRIPVRSKCERSIHVFPLTAHFDKQA